MEAASVIPVKLGMVNAYIVKQEGTLIIDTGIPGSEEAIISALEKADISKHDSG
jgi:hydroxyacylglutathione hydrolase